MAFTYMLLCSDGSLYVGSTRDLDHRLQQHAVGEGAAYTRRRLPVQLVWFEEHENVALAFAREKQVQRWGRAKRLTLVEGRYDLLAGMGPSAWRRRSRPDEEPLA